MLTVLVVGLFLLMSTLEMVRTRVLIRVGNCLDMDLNRRIFTAAFERNLSRAGGNPAQALQDLAQVRQFVTGNSLFAFFDAPWTPIYLLVAYLIHPLLGLLTLIGSLILVTLAWLTEKATQKPLAEANQAAMSSAQYANNNLRNAEVIEAMGMLPSISKRWFQSHLRILEMQTLASDRAALISSTGRFVRITLQSLILGAGALLAIEGKITPGMMIACSILTGRALGPVEQAAKGHAGGGERVCRRPRYQQHDSARGGLQPCPRRKPWHYRSIRLGQIHPRPPAGWRLAGAGRQGAPGRRGHIHLEQGRTWPLARLPATGRGAVRGQHRRQHCALW
jgi:ABC-type protease/lipase transport system fused ATPase/permease subunit